jgi:serine/threonine protein kinase
MSNSTARLPPIRHYEVLRHLGSGGMADVFLAVNPGLQGRLQRKLAIKRIKAGHVEDESMRELFLDEMTLLGALDHENIVACYDSGEENGVYDLVMEYVEGPTLRSIGRHLARHDQRMSLSLVLEIARQLLGGLVHAHERTDDEGNPLNIVHRDVSPQNALVSHQGQCKLMDFGIAQFAGRYEYTATRELRGKADYISPEHINKRPLDGRSDLFSLGIMLRELLTGHHPFVPQGQGRPSNDQLMELIRQGSFIPLLKEAPNFDSDLAAWFDALIQHDADARPQSARLALRALVNHPIRPDAKLMLGELALTTTKSAWGARSNPPRQPAREAQSAPATPVLSSAPSSGSQDDTAGDDPALDLLERERALVTGSGLRPETASGPVLRVSRPTTETSSSNLLARLPRTWYAAAAVALISGGSALYLTTHQPLAVARSRATGERTDVALSGSAPPADVLRPTHVREVTPAEFPNRSLPNSLSMNNAPPAPTSPADSPASEREPLASLASDAGVRTGDAGHADDAGEAGRDGSRPVPTQAGPKTCDESKASAKIMIDPWGYIWFRKRPLGRAPQVLECLKPGNYVVEIGQQERGTAEKHKIVLNPGRNDIVLQIR